MVAAAALCCLLVIILCNGSFTASMCAWLYVVPPQLVHAEIEKMLRKWGSAFGPAGQNCDPRCQVDEDGHPSGYTSSSALAMLRVAAGMYCNATAAPDLRRICASACRREVRHSSASRKDFHAHISPPCINTEQMLVVDSIVSFDMRSARSLPLSLVPAVLLLLTSCCFAAAVALTAASAIGTVLECEKHSFAIRFK